MSFVVEISISTTLLTILNHSLDFTSTVTFTDKVKVSSPLRMMRHSRGGWYLRSLLYRGQCITDYTTNSLCRLCTVIVKC